MWCVDYPEILLPPESRLLRNIDAQAEVGITVEVD
eukprot:COSAG03_NODE_17991_length_364_cov_0.633962_1_plen_34_part_10